MYNFRTDLWYGWFIIIGAMDSCFSFGAFTKLERTIAFHSIFAGRYTFFKFDMTASLPTVNKFMNMRALDFCITMALVTAIMYIHFFFRIALLEIIRYPKIFGSQNQLTRMNDWIDKSSSSSERIHHRLHNNNNKHRRQQLLTLSTEGHAIFPSRVYL